MRRRLARVSVIRVGQCFACAARVRAGHWTIYRTGVYPYGMEHQAYRAAREWALANGYEVIE
jgi:hypothetical protein